MKISYNLLKTLIDFDWTPDVLAERLTMSGSEVEAVEIKGADIEGIITAKVLSADRVPASTRLSLCRIFNGRGEYQVICGAPNVAAGQIVLFAPPESKIPGRTLEKTAIHGLDSFGMILSEAELELSENAEGIAVLPPDTRPGIPLERIVNFKDTIFELEITPNRPDCLAHIGVAREIQALGGGKFRLPDISLVEINERASDAVKIAIDDAKGCPRYTGRLIRDAIIEPSPLWLKMMVHYLGMRPINNIVDITNFVMLELGHPLHAFDYDLFMRPEVRVRRAAEGEEFLTLDGMARKLNSDHLLITDGSEAVAIAGIMGGEKSEISSDTRNILLESAYFDPVTIRRGSKYLGLGTESSRRFERGADPEMAPIANDRACKLITELAGGKILKGIVDVYSERFVPVKIDLRPSRVNKILGTNLASDRIKDILQSLDIDVSGDGNYIVRQPSFRPDLTREIDLIEEIARIHGLENIPSKFRPGGSLVTPESRIRAITGKMRSYLVGSGATEIFPITLVDSRITEHFRLADFAVRIMNPLSEEMAVVRPSLILSAFPVIRRNFGFKEKDLYLFEIGNYYMHMGKGKLPAQKTALLIAQTGFESPVFWDGKPRQRDLFSLKGVIENIADYFKMGGVELKPAGHFAFELTRSFAVYINNTPVGHLGKLSREGCAIADIKGDVYLAEIEFDRFIELIPESLAASELARFPSADRDIAVIVADNVKSEEIKLSIIETGGEIVDDVWVFDLYKGKNIPDGFKSLAYGIRYRLSARTLTDEEVDQVHGKIADALKGKFGAQLRS